jgi:tetratricopeptide (TPR) repeat protein
MPTIHESPFSANAVRLGRPVCRLAWYLIVSLGLAGCATTVNVEERVRDLNDLGLTDFTQGRFPEARECFELALQLTPQDPNLLFNLAQCDDRLGGYRNAEQYYVLCLQKNPGHVEARYALVMLYYRTGRKAEAGQQITQWLTEQPNSPEPYALDGWRLRQENDLVGARDRLFEALAKAKNQKNAHALTELGIVYEKMNHLEHALTYYTRSLECNPNQPDVIDRLVQLRLSKVGPPRPE